MRLDPREYFRLLALVEPVASTSEGEFLARLEQHESYADVARGLLAGASVAEALELLRKLSPGDDFFSHAEPLPHRLALLGHLADRYSLSARLVRNRRVKVGAFTARVLRRTDVAEGAKRAALVELCAKLAKQGEKVLVFGHDVEALRELQGGIAVAGPRGAPVRRRAVESRRATGSSRASAIPRGRCSSSPASRAARAGTSSSRTTSSAPTCRSRRSCSSSGSGGSTGSASSARSRSTSWSRRGTRRSSPTCTRRRSGFSTSRSAASTRCSRRSRTSSRALRRKRSARTRDAFRADLAARVAAARKAQHEGDPLLDIRSASLPELARLVRGAFERLGDEAPEDIDAAGPEAAGEAISESLVTLSRWLEEELEDVVVEVGRRVGMEVDTDQNVHPFEAAFTIGAGMKIEALPGMEMPEDPVTLLGSFWRETAVARDELQWFATGHRLVEALVGIVRDGDAGRAAAVKREWAPRRGGLYVRFTPALATSADVAPGARVASRQASRYLDLAPISVLVDLEAGNRVVAGGAARLEDEIEEAEAARVGGAPPALLEAARAAAEQEARAILARRIDEAKALLLAHADAEEERLVESSFQGGALGARGRRRARRPAPAPRGGGDRHRPREARARRGRARRAVAEALPLDARGVAL